MRPLVHYLLPLVCLFAATEAHAGGIGLLGNAAVHTDPVYYYDSTNNDLQYKQTQYNPSAGAGLEVILGDKDDKITGVFRGYWLQDQPQTDPATGKKYPAGDVVVDAVRTTPRNIGVATFGVEWGFLGHPDKFQLCASTSLGSGFITTDHTEFLMAVIGVGPHYRIGRSMQVYADVDFLMRYRKTYSFGGTAFAGVRYLFD